MGDKQVGRRSDPEFKMLSLLGNPGAGPMSGAVSAGGMRSRCEGTIGMSKVGDR